MNLLTTPSSEGGRTRNVRDGPAVIIAGSRESSLPAENHFASAVSQKKGALSAPSLIEGEGKRKG